MLRRLKRKIRRAKNKASDLFSDPPLDVVGAGVMATLTGRTLLYGAFGFTFVTVGMYLHAAVFTAVILIDALVHLEVLGALRRLMQREVEDELRTLGYLTAG